MSGEISCPCCGGEKITKNGHFRGKQRYVCKECQKSFSEESTKQFPPTTIPFEFIAYTLYKRERDGNNRGFCKLINKILELTILEKKKVSRSTVYSWIGKYGNSYKSLISENEASDFFIKNIDHEAAVNRMKQPIKAFYRKRKSVYKRKVKKTRKELRKLPEVYGNILSTEEYLQWLVDTLGVDYARKFVRWWEKEKKRI